MPPELSTAECLACWTYESLQIPLQVSIIRAELNLFSREGDKSSVSRARSGMAFAMPWKDATYYKCMAKFGGMTVSDTQRRTLRKRFFSRLFV